MRDKLATADDIKFWGALILSSVSESKVLRIMFLLLATYTYFKYHYRKRKNKRKANKK